MLGCQLSTARGPGPSLLSAALGWMSQEQPCSIEKLISLLEGICQHELGLSCLSLGLKAQTGSGPRGADSGLAPPGIQEGPAAKATGVRQDELLHISRDTAKATVISSIFPRIRKQVPDPSTGTGSHASHCAHLGPVCFILHSLPRAVPPLP